MTRRGERPHELDRWLEDGEEVTALFDCALRGVEQGNRSVAEETVLTLMSHLDPKGREAGGRVLAHFDSCLAQIERGAYEEAFELLLDLKESWVEALAALRRDRHRAANVN
ncbi:MAG TPA: hypothetical protein VF363_05295 [Candidatus Eisenbacteria bacterium]